MLGPPHCSDPLVAPLPRYPGRRARSQLPHIVFGGSFIRDHPYTIATISSGVRFFSRGTVQALFLRHDGFVGAVGAHVAGLDDSQIKTVLRMPEEHERPPQGGPGTPGPGTPGPGTPGPGTPGPGGGMEHLAEANAAQTEAARPSPSAAAPTVASLHEAPAASSAELAAWQVRLDEEAARRRQAEAELEKLRSEMARERAGASAAAGGGGIS